MSCITIEDISLSLVVVVPLGYYRGVEQWSARYFDLVEVRGSNPCPATMNINLKNDTIMNILPLSIKQKYFDEILSGKKDFERREIKPSNVENYVSFIVDGKEYEREEDIPDGDSEVMVKAKSYDKLKLVTGEYKGKRPYLIVEVKDARVEFLYDENGDFIIGMEKGKEYALAYIIFELGNIVETFKGEK